MEKSPASRWFVKTLLTAACLLPAVGEGLILAGAKSQGMAGAVMAYPVDAFSQAYNPATLPLLCNRIDGGGYWTHRYQRINIREVSSGDSTGSFNAAEDPVKKFGEVAGVKTFRTCLFSCPLDLSFGAAYYIKNFYASKYKEAIASDTLNVNDGRRRSFFFGTTKTEFDYMQQVVTASLALRFQEKYALGIAMNYNIQYLNVKGVEERTSPITITSTDPTALSNRGDDTSKGVGFMIGGLWQPMRCVRIAVAYEPKTSMDRFTKYQGFIADNGAFDLPQRVRAGVSYDYSRTLGFAADYEYIDWSVVRQMRNRANFSRPFGSKKGPGFKWQSQAIYRVGMDWQVLSCLSLRVGFEHANRLFLNRHTILNTLGMNLLNDTVTFGATYRLDRSWEVSAFYGMGLEHSVFGKDVVRITSPDGVSSQAVDLKKSMKTLGLNISFLF